MSKLTEVKRVKNLVLMKDGSDQRFFKLDGVRLSYAYIGTAAPDENDSGDPTPKWRTVCMVPKDTHKEAYDLIMQVVEKMKKEAESKVPADKLFITDGDDKDDENMHGHWLISASDGKIRPTARDRRGNVIDDISKIDDTFYSGSWANVLIRPWFFAGKGKNGKTYPKRIACGLTGLQFLKDDTAFGAGRVDDSDAWEDLGGGAGASADLDDDEDL